MGVAIDTRVAGVTYGDSQRVLACLEAAPTTPVALVRDPQNAYDPNAVEVVALSAAGSWLHVGYVPREGNMAAAVAGLIDAGWAVRVASWQVGHRDVATPLGMWLRLEVEC